MERFYVKKIFEISYAHRLLDYNGKCENLHGHNGKIEVIIKAEKLNSQMMVMDFVDLKKKVKQWLDENLDHKVILSRKDPLIKSLMENSQKIFITEENPTAEFLAMIIKKELKKIGIVAHRLRFWETDTSMAEIKEE